MLAPITNFIINPQTETSSVPSKSVLGDESSFLRGFWRSEISPGGFP